MMLSQEVLIHVANASNDLTLPPPGYRLDIPGGGVFVRFDYNRLKIFNKIGYILN